MSELLSEIGEMLGTSNEEDLEPVEEEVEDPQEEHEDGVSDTEEEVPGEEEEEIQEGEEDSLDESGLDTGEEDESLEQDPTSDVSSPSESSETISLRAEVKSLREMLQSVTSQLLQQQTLPRQAAQQDAAPPPVSDTNFLDGEDFDDVLTNPEAFNRLLIKVANLSQQNVVPVVTERVLTTTQRQRAQQKAVDNFYRKNPDLAGVRQTVSMVSQNLGAQNPNLTLEQLLEQTATMTRTMLQMPLKPQTNKTSPGPTKVIRRVASPAKATTNASRKQKPTTKKKSSLQTDIEAMLNAV